MLIPFVVFFVEMLRAALGGVLDGAQAWRTVQQELTDEIAAARDDAAMTAVEVPGKRITRGASSFQEPVGIDPLNPSSAPASPHSILSEGDELPGFLQELAQAGVGIEAGPGETLTATAAASAGGGTLLPAVRYRLRTYTLYPPTPFAEPFNLMIPSPLPATARPLLVVFHKYGSSHDDLLQNTDYVLECARRGWFVVCPVGASKKHFGSIESQINTEAVLDWLLANASLRIDRQRIYGVGFSMGGAAALNYAARHHDPAHAIFAAVINHSGGVALNHTYFADPSARFVFDFWFGDGSVGSAEPWKMTRSSVIDFDPITHVVDTSSDLARNLGSTAVGTWQASLDTIPYLPVQNGVLDQHFTSHLNRGSDPDYSYNLVPYAGHSWRMLDASAACDWLGQFTLQVPSSGRALVDHDGVFEHFYVEQDSEGAFSPFDWSLDAQLNELRLSETANLKRVTIDPIASGLSTTSQLHVSLATADASGDELMLTHWPQTPSAITRDGVASASWLYDSQTRELTLIETDGAPHAWIVVP